MQRLRRIKQLGLTSLFYPSATHTRFQYSLGVMHLAGKFADSLGLSQRKTKELRLAGLLHDTGHGPFSHASEFVIEEYGLKYEDFSCEVVERSEDLYSVEPERIRKIMKGESEIGQVIPGDIDADRMDYLMRDSISIGVEHGEIDAETIIRLADMYNKRLVFEGKAVPTLESLLTSRYHMIKTVYRHHTAEIGEKMLAEALEAYISSGNDVERTMRMDDYEIHNRLIENGGVSEEIYKRIQNGNLFKRALVKGVDKLSREELQKLEDKLEKSNLKTVIANIAGVEEKEVIVDPPSTPSIENIDVKIRQGNTIREMSEFSPISNALADAEWNIVSFKVYSPENKIEEVKKASLQVLNSFLS